MHRVLALAYGLVSYLLFFVSFVYAIGFVANDAAPGARPMRIAGAAGGP